MAQVTFNGFLPINKDTNWQKVIETTLNFKQITDKIKSSGLFENHEFGKNSVMGNIKPIEADLKGAGYVEMVTPMYIPRSFLVNMS